MTQRNRIAGFVINATATRRSDTISIVGRSCTHCNRTSGCFYSDRATGINVNVLRHTCTGYFYIAVGKTHRLAKIYRSTGRC